MMATTWLSRIFMMMLSALSLLILPMGQEVLGQTWPSKTIIVVNPFGAGGTGDVLARGFAQVMTKELGQNAIVENRPGSAGNIGSAAVARSVPDGHTILFASTGPLATNKLMYKSMPLDPDKELLPVILAGKIHWLILLASIPAR
jgi:tripartite-type tricarboxylate transporter receptor subunit TctC